MIIRLENKKNDDLYIENQKKAKLAEQEKQAALLKSIEDEKRLSEENIKIDKEKILELEKLVEQLKLEIAQKNEIISNLTNKKNE